jgi:hypothetical protein
MALLQHPTRECLALLYKEQPIPGICILDRPLSPEKWKFQHMRNYAFKLAVMDENKPTITKIGMMTIPPQSFGSPKSSG